MISKIFNAFLTIGIVGILVAGMIVIVVLPARIIQSHSVENCEFAYEVGQNLYHDHTSFVEEISVEETLKVVDSEGNETCLYKFDNSSLYFSQEDVLENYMTEEQ